MITALEFLAGKPNPDGLDVDWIVNAFAADLETRHDWIQWAFPNDVPSAFNPDAPLVTELEMRSLDDLQQQNLRRLLDTYMQFLGTTERWRRTNDHNHMRITRVIRCLALAGWDALARQVYDFVTVNCQPSATTLRFWRDALPADRRPR